MRKLVSIETLRVRDKYISIQPVNWKKYWKNILGTLEVYFQNNR